MPGLSHSPLALMADMADHNFRRRITGGVLQKYFLSVCFTEIFKIHCLCGFVFLKKSCSGFRTGVPTSKSHLKHPNGCPKKPLKNFDKESWQKSDTVFVCETKRLFLWLLTDYFHAEYPAVKKWYFSDWGHFFLNFHTANKHINHSWWLYMVVVVHHAPLGNKSGLTRASQF